MNLKQRFSFIFSCLFSLVLAAVLVNVYYIFADLRQTEFIAILKEKARISARLLIDLKEIDYNMQKIIDKNSVNKSYNEKTEIYDDTRKLLYNSYDYPTIKWNTGQLEQLKKKKQVFTRADNGVVLGLYEAYGGKMYYILISADDTDDITKLEHIRYTLLGVFIVTTGLIWLLSFSLSKKALQPLDNFRKKIQGITDSNLKIRLSRSAQEDEINSLAGSFNQMMDRIDTAYHRQKEFTSNASHELRTPIARITAQLENLMNREGLEAAVKANLESISDDAFQLSEVVSSLVALADINSREHRFSFAKLRLDELIYNAVAALSKTYPGFKLKFEILNETAGDTAPEIMGDEPLLKIALSNLLKNAFMYSDNHFPECMIVQQQKHIQLLITNTGPTPDVGDTAKLFSPFYRGSNSTNTAGRGVGLSIVKRIVDYHKADIVYNIIDDNTNQLLITFNQPV